MENMAQEPNRCPNCGGPLSDGAVAGFCPACLLAQGAQTDSNAPDRGGFEPPPVAELARLFPQLEILDLLGAGGMGAVYKARQPALDRLVALKILPRRGASGGSFAERFNREARALARLSHPNIVAVHEFGQVDGLHFFIMEFVDGADLRQLENGARLSPREALQIIPQICDALQYAHDEGVVHRDIKPENVLVDRRGRVKIADFGLAKILGQDAESLRLTAEGQVMGTPHYMAPEQIERPLAVDHRADIYSLGVVFYEMLTGDLPLGKFPPPSSRLHGLQVDVRLDEVVLRALENDPERRYQRASDVKSRVETISSTAPAQSDVSPIPPSAPGERYLHWAGFPVVLERDGTREVSMSGFLSALAAATALIFVAAMLVWAITGNRDWNIKVPSMVAILVVVLGVRHTLRRPWDDEPSRTAQGTVILETKRKRSYAQWLALGSVLIFTMVWGVALDRRAKSARFISTKVAVAQIAKPDAQTGAWVASLPEGGSVELLAVSDEKGAPNGWWHPEGTPITNSTFVARNLGEAPLVEGIRRNLLIHFQNLPEGASGPFLHSDPPMGSSGGGEVFRDGRQLRNAWVARVAWPQTARKGTVWIGFGIAEWRTIALHEPQRRSSTHTRKPGDPRWKTRIHQVGEANGSVQVTLVHGPEDQDWTSRVIAVDTNGHAHSYVNAYSSEIGTSAEKTKIWTATFRELPLASVKEIQVQVRRVHWIEFRDVALQPNRPVPQARPAIFTPVQEIEFSELIDFDTGRTAHYPAGKPRRDLFDGFGEEILWMQENGFDAAAGTGELHPLDMLFVALENADWDNLGPDEFIQRLYHGLYKPRVLKPLKEGELPATFGFRTREDGFGMLQIVAFAEDRPGATVRFKLVQDHHFN
jgi:predicted Ser/Thr protein kinase